MPSRKRYRCHYCGLLFNAWRPWATAPDGRRKERRMRSRIRSFVLGSALVITLTVPVAAGMPSDADLLVRMQQEVQKLQQQRQTTYAQCQAGQRRACEQISKRDEQLARLQKLIEECQQDNRESCTQLRTLRRR
jgi:TolA-binding protein